MDLQALAATVPVARASFPCAKGHGVAGEVRLHGEGEAWVVVVAGFLSVTVRIGSADAAGVRSCLQDQDAGGLYELDLEYAPFYCPRCQAVYCGECWRTYNVFDEEMPGWFEETRGICPEGHERMLMD